MSQKAKKKGTGLISGHQRQQSQSSGIGNRSGAAAGGSSGGGRGPGIAASPTSSATSPSSPSSPSNQQVYPVKEFLAANAGPLPLSTRSDLLPQSYAQTLAAKGQQTQTNTNSNNKTTMSGKQPVSGASRSSKAASTAHGRPALEVPEPPKPRPPSKAKGNGPAPNENWEQDGEMNAHLAEKFRKGGAWIKNESSEQAEGQKPLPPHPLVGK